MLSNALDMPSTDYLDPMDFFIDAHLAFVNTAKRNGRKPEGCHLFLVDIGDDHFSAAGSELWAAAVGKRLILLMERDLDLPVRYTAGLAVATTASRQTSLRVIPALCPRVVVPAHSEIDVPALPGSAPAGHRSNRPRHLRRALSSGMIRRLLDFVSG